jgi:hypothetical protein
VGTEQILSSCSQFKFYGETLHHQVKLQGFAACIRQAAAPHGGLVFCDNAFILILYPFIYTMEAI